MRRRDAIIGVLTSLVLAVGAPNLVQADYPDPPPAFPQIPPDGFNPGTPLFSPTGGHLDRPLLVIYVHFLDQPEQAGKTDGWVRNRFMFNSPAAFPNARDFFAVNSFGALQLTPAAETQGVAGDGVVSVVAGDLGDWIDPTVSNEARNRMALQLADPWVDFSQFDDDGDGHVSNDELMVVNIRVARDGDVFGINGPAGCPAGLPPEEQAKCGPDIGEVANRSVAPGANLDGVGFGGLGVAMLSTESNFSTTVHEMGHSLVGMADLYGPRGNLDGYDTAGATLGTGFDWTVNFGAWNKMHWGWITPTVVTRDGYYDVPDARTSGVAFVLYDPDRGVQDFLLVENRQRTAGSYDANVFDSGLVVYRVGEKDFFAATPGQPYPAITIVGPDSSFQAWDPSDPNTPDRDLLDATWRDGSSARVRIRAVGDSGSTIRVFFDVPGPGVLIDPYSLQGTVLDPGEWNSLAIPVTNTGELGAVFRVNLVAPAGWQVKAPASTWIEPGLTAMVPVEVRPYFQSVIGEYQLDLTAEAVLNPAVASAAPLRVMIDEPPRVFFDCTESFCTNVVITLPGLPPITIPVRIRLPGRWEGPFPSPQ